MKTNSKSNTTTQIKGDKPKITNLVLKAREEEKESVVVKQLKPKPEKKVKFTEDTINNEHMGKKKSKSNFFGNN